MIKIILFFVLLLPGFVISWSQDYSKPLNYTFGAGLNFMGNGDLMALNIENEISYKLNNYLSAGVCFGIGRSLSNSTANNNYLDGGLNVFVSPFRNDRRNNFKIGGGYRYINSSSTYIGAIYYIPDYSVKYVYSKASYHAFDVILEDDYWISSKLFVGFEFSMSATKSFGAIMSGGLIKLGISF